MAGDFRHRDQGASTADGFASASVPCDGRWYPVDVPLVGSGSFQPGKVTFSFLQFLVTNAVTGDSAGAHDNGASAVTARKLGGYQAAAMMTLPGVGHVG